MIAVRTVLALVLLSANLLAEELPPDWPRVPMMDLPAATRAWYKNPDGSCVQCSGGMIGAYRCDFNLATLLWDSPYGPAVRGGSTPSRVANYCRERGIAVYNITGNRIDETIPWADWAVRTGRFAFIAAGSAHFQTLYGRDQASNSWFICDNNSTSRIDRYSHQAFRNLHAASGPWIVIPKGPPPAPNPVLVRWW